jgi:hypothetical protein
VVTSVGSHDDALAFARGVAEAPPVATREVKRRALLAGETTWLASLADEMEQLRLALLI